jgi:hypothetical protein
MWEGEQSRCGFGAASEPNPLTPFPVSVVRHAEGGTESRGQPLHPWQESGSVVAGGEEPNPLTPFSVKEG